MKEMLVFVGPQQNSNKFYEITLEGDNVIARYGRIGQNGVTRRYDGGEHKFYQLLRQKTAKGYRKVDVDNVTQVSSEAVKASLGITDDVIDYLLRVNRHDIATKSGGSIIAKDGVLTTAVGKVSSATIIEARNVLEEIENGKNDSFHVAEYLRLIPQIVQGRDWGETFFDSQEKIDRQKEFLEQLDSTISVTSEADFGISLKKVSNETLKALREEHLNSRVLSHPSSHLRIKQAYEIIHPAAKEQLFEKVSKDKGNVRKLWHGSDQGNILSILHKGLFCPNVNDPRYTPSGRMFGDGVYFSNVSTKSLNYSYGVWGGKRGQRVFAFMADVVMGKEYWPNRDPQGFSDKRAHAAFDSISAKAGTTHYGMRLANNEMIVWNTQQIKLKYLIEFE